MLESGSRLQQENVEAARSKLLRDDGTGSAGTDDDDVTQWDLPRFVPASSP